ncbi:MAG: hypothetical protein ACLR7Z_10770 [Bilophila wadsworthia]
MQNGTDNAIIRAAQDRQQLALKQQLTAAETIYQQKLKALPTALGSFSSSLAGVGRMAKTAGSALLGAFGGPVGLAVTALTAGLGYLATQEDAATKFSANTPMRSCSSATTPGQRPARWTPTGNSSRA